jgi:3-hydroxybutyryl-CoA dehydrogenase
MDIQRVGIVGCGLMGSGIAQVAAEAGFQVVVKEIDPAALEKGQGRIRAQWTRAVEKGKRGADEVSAFEGRMTGTTVFDALSACDLVIEAVPELEKLKLETFAALDKVMRADAILCSNTSSLPIGGFGGALAPARLPRMAGLHFFNPVPAMPLVEIIRTLATEAATVEALKAFVQKVGKTPILAPDAPGFVVNRLLVPYLNDAMRCAEQGLASVEDIDLGMKLGCGHPMGPLHLSDFIGLDTMLNVSHVMFDAHGEARYKAPVILQRLVAAGRLGRKSGLGFYRWEGEARKEPMPL